MGKWLTAVMTVSSIALVGATAFLYVSRDTNGPEISFENGKNLKYEEGMKEAELLKNVKAVDKKDGDVSNTLMVENIFPKGSDKVVVSYVAKDTSNNVTKKERVLEISDGSDTEDNNNAENDAQAAGSQAQEAEVTTTPAADQTATITDETEAESAARKIQEDKIALLAPEAPKVRLTTYYVELPVGTAMNQLNYVESIEDDADDVSELYKYIIISGGVNTNVPGTYELSYYVIDSDGNSSNSAVLTVVVK